MSKTIVFTAGQMFFLLVFVGESSVFHKSTTEFRIDNPIESIAETWISNVNSYRYRFEIHGSDEDGNKTVRFLEASGDKRDHTLVVEYDRNDHIQTIVMANPKYIAIIRAFESEYQLVELRENVPSPAANGWIESRGIDPYFNATTMFFLMRTKEIVGLEQKWNSEERMEWVPNNEVGVDEGGQRLTKIVALISGADINEVQLATEQMIANKIYAKTTTAIFEDWREIDGTRIPFVAKYFLDNASRPYSEFRVASPSDITFNSPFEESACYLQFYGLPEPGLQSATPGLSGWWLWGAVVAGISLMLLPIFLVRRSKG